MTAFDPFQAPEHLSSMSRFRVIDKLDRIFKGKQYDGRPDWWTGCHREGQDPVPVRQRKPCVRYLLAAAATNQVVRFLFGDKRYPRVSFPHDDESTDVKEGDVTKAQAEQLERWIDDLTEAAHLKPIVRSMTRMGVSRKTAVVICELQDGEFRFTLPSPQHCFAQFKDGTPQSAVTRLVWCYEFDKEVVDTATGRPKSERYIFRREWDETNVTSFHDVKKEAGKRVQWSVSKQEPHGLTFCPVLWIRNDAEDLTDIDGRGLYEGIEDDLEALDITLSRRHQGVVHLGAPQPYETGVEDGDGPEGLNSGDPGGFNGTTTDSPVGRVEGPVRRVAPDAMWTYQGEKVTVGLLEVSGKAFDVATKHVDDIRSRSLETMGVVLTSMADTVSRITTGAEMSAKFLALAHAPLIALVQEYRHTWWDRGMLVLLRMCMRMTAELSKAGQTISVSGTDEIATLLQGFNGAEGWKPPRMEPKWGRFFEPSTQEIKTTVEAATKAKDGSLIQHKTAVEHVAPDFGVQDIQAELEAIEKARAEAEKRDNELVEIARGIGGGAQEGPPQDRGGRGAADSASQTSNQRGAPQPGQRSSGGGAAVQRGAVGST